MENLPRSRHPNRVSRKACNGNVRSGGAKTLHDDVFAGPTKFGVPTLSPRAEDYCEIFGSFNASRASSIPVLDLPEVDEAEVYFDVRSSGFDYSDVFGGFDGADFAASFEDLFGQSMGMNAVDCSSEEAWTPAETESLSEESYHSEKDTCFSIEDPYQSFEGSTEFSISYQKASQSTEEDLSKGLRHTAEVLAVPKYSFLVNQTAPSLKTGSKSGSLLVTDDANHNMEFTGGKQLRKATPPPPPPHACDGRETFGSDLGPQRGYGTDCINSKGFVTISEISLQTEPSHLPPPSRPPPLLDVKKEGSSRSTSNCKSTNSDRSSRDGSPPFFDVEVDASSSAAASAAAMKEAMRMAQAKMKTAKELMERKKEGFQSHTQPDSKSSINNKEGHLAKKSAEEKRGRGSFSSQGSDKVDGADEWKDSTQFFELVRTDQPRKAVEQTNIEQALEHNAKVLRGQKENWAAMETCELQGEHAKKTQSVWPEYELKETKLTEEDFDLEENNGRPKTAKDRHRLKKHEKMVKMAQEVHEQEDIMMNFGCEVEQTKMNDGNEHKLKETGERRENEKNSREYHKSAGSEMKRHEVFYQENIDKRAKEALQQDENEKRLKGATGRDEKKKLKEARERAENEKRLIEALQQVENERRLEEALEQAENEKKLKEASEREEKERRQRKTREREKNEKRLKEAREREENEKKLSEAREREEAQRRQRKAREREENERRLKEAREREENEKRIKEAREKEEKETRLKEAREKEENEKRLKEARERQENENRLIEARERQENEKRQKEARERQENEKRQKEACERKENEQRQKEARKREENEKRQKEAHEREETEKRQKEAREREENEKRQNEAREQEENEKRQKETCEREENEKRQNEAREQEENDKRQKEAREREENEKRRNEAREREYNEKREKEAREREEKEKRWREALVQEESVNKQTTESQERDDTEKRFDNACGEDIENRFDDFWEQEINKLRNQTEKDKKLELPKVNNKGNVFKDNENVADEPEGSERQSEAVEMKSVAFNERNKTSGIAQANSEQKVENAVDGNSKNAVEVGIGAGVGQTCVNKSWKQALNQGENVQKFMSTEMGKESVDNRGKVEADQPAILEMRGNAQKTDKQVNGRQSTVRKHKDLNDSRVSEEKETDRVKRERELEKERLKKLEEEIEREREREKDRMAVDRATFEARESAREKAERVAMERATAEARQRALAEARERLEKACAEAREKSLPDKAAMEARLRADRAAVERATAEARERAAFGARERVERSVSDKFTSSSRNGGMRQSSSSSDLLDPHSQSVGSSVGSRNLNSSVSGASYFAERTEGVEGESAQRCRARLERHQRTAERAAKALAEKNMRDLLALREQAERNRLSETLDAEVKRWSSGKEGNLRALLSTLQYILGSDSGWQPVPLTEVITNAAVKKAYRKATLCVHPDKLQQRGANIQQKYICEKVFDLLKEAWNRFNSEER